MKYKNANSKLKGLLFNILRRRSNKRLDLIRGDLVTDFYVPIISYN